MISLLGISFRLLLSSSAPSLHLWRGGLPGENTGLFVWRVEVWREEGLGAESWKLFLFNAVLFLPIV